MGTWMAFYINTGDKQAIAGQLSQLTGDLTVTQDTGFPGDIAAHLILNDGWTPSYLAVGNTQPDWTTVVHNSSSKLEDWAEQLSEQFSCRLIVTIAQSVSDYYYFALYEKGIKRREIETCYSDDSEPIDDGDKLDFENFRVGYEEDEDDDDRKLFDFDSIEAYCHHFGLAIQTDYDAVKWTVLKDPNIRNEVDEFLQRYRAKKPWWKFW